ncbi:unnamed protein product [Nippostrongylus brasiliensis]|uniref:Leptin receptor overlapping transcript-like 1 n=1 Tax=Nippostrongylus brasiliensis TaxID=27835 RepID=A0A0N4Y9W1_NIPBR|nr:unnamed protein product [Nippostrongylus brasiliensis]
MFVVIFYILAPIPLLISRYYDDGMRETDVCFEFALFVTTVIIVSAFALPGVLAHTGKIKVMAMLLANTGSIVTFLTILAYFYLHREDDLSSWGQSFS